MRLLQFSFLFLAWNSYAQTTLISQSSAWKYYDLGQTPAGWTQVNYNDNAWSSGNAELGYGDGDEATTVSYGPDSGDKYITTYFRKTFTVADPSLFASLTMNLKRDDGAVIYLNGTEVWRSNMPAGTVSFSTEASSTVAWPYEDNWYNQVISAMYLQTGQNVIAVEVHQDDNGSSDISFNFSLVANPTLAASVTRGPYLQKGTQQSMMIRWRTDNACDAKVKYGISPSNLNQEVSLPYFTTEHSIEITGLSADTKYYYSIGTNNTVLMSGNDMYFETLPLVGTEDKFQFMVIGDAGTGAQIQVDAKNAFIAHNATNHYDGLILLGDNAYQSGFDSEYQSNFFDNKYSEIYANTVIWPAPGNHDYNNHIPFSPSPAYYDIFDCPSNGECGGVPSGTEKYYSFNYGNIHFVSLDSYDEDRSTDAAMATWLEQDLAANNQEWLVAFFHHPPYTKGSHDSDNSTFIDGELPEIRENIIPILEAHGVDLVLNGHSHSYERSMLIDGHYGNSDQFGPTYTKDNGSGSYPQECPYVKNTTTDNGHQGTIYSVVGCSGKTSSVQSDWPHPVMYSYNGDKVGILSLTIEKNRLDAVFVTSQGEEYDKFTILKNAGTETTVYSCQLDTVELTASWPENVTWSPYMQNAQSINVQAVNNVTVTASDANHCVEDIFHIQLVMGDSCQSALGVDQLTLNQNPEAFIASGDLTVKLPANWGEIEMKLYSISGKLLKTFIAASPEHHEDVSDLPKGIYLLKPGNINYTLKLNNHD